jgi:GNAT superfamily N-acetyltransferase
MAFCDIGGVRFRRKYRAVPLDESEAEAISAVYKAVWLTACNYPQEWREKRAMTADAVRSEMNAGYCFFGVHATGTLVGVYKASITERGCYGEQQAVLPEYQNQGVAYALYEQFLTFAKTNHCKVNYVNILIGNEPCERAMQRYHFCKTGEPWEQAKGMWVQTYERKVDEDC